MVRFRQWWWRMDLAIGVAYVVSVLEYRSEASGGLAALLEAGVYSVCASTFNLSSDVATYVAGPLVFGTIPAICALVVYHFLIGRAHRAAIRSAETPAAEADKAAG